MTVRRVFIFLLVVAAASLRGEIPADAPDNRGTDFIVAFPQNVSMPPNPQHRLSLFVAAEQATRVEVSGPEVVTAVVDIAASSVRELFYQSAVPQVSRVNEVGQEGIRVRSVDPLDPAKEGPPIAVYALNRRPLSAGAYMALPVDALGTEYRGVARPGVSPSATGSQVTIVATEANTTVYVTPPVKVPGVTGKDEPKEIFFTNPLQTFLLQSSNGDLTGTLVTSDKPIAVFAGNQNGTTGGSADHIVEQMVPVTTWGSEFVIAPIAPRTAGDLVRVVAHEDGTDVDINGTVVATLAAGQFYEFTQPSAAGTLLKTSKPSLVAQYNKGQLQGDAVLTDPFAMLVPPASQFSRQYLFRTPGAPTAFSNRLNIVVKNGDEAGLLLNGAALPGGTIWTAVGSYSYARVMIAAGATHRLEHQEPTVRFGAWVYGHALGEGYGYAAGQFVADETAPVLSSVPADLTLEATGPFGATATWSDPTATDFGRGELPVTCTPPSGSVFALGMHVIDCSATDPVGNTTTESFSVTVQDTTPPELHLPQDIIVAATGPNGAVVSYQATATDIADPDVAVVCSPPSGGFFPVGPNKTTFTTVVTCTATDDSGNFTTGTFNVTVTNSPPICVATPSISQIWPSNHRLVPISVHGPNDPDGAATIRIDSIFQDEPTNTAGDGNTAVDGFGVGTSVAQVRAERSGGGNGRVYHIRFTATDLIGASCSDEVTVGVPRNQKDAPAVDDGALYSSTAP